MLFLTAPAAQGDPVALLMVLILAVVVAVMALEEDPHNFLLMHSIGVNVSGQIASVIAGGIILNIAAKLMGG